MENIKVFGSDEMIKTIQQKENPAFLCVMSNTAVSKIPKITGAGSPEFTSYTPALDAEVILKDMALSLPNIASTDADELSAPSPALLTKATIDLLNIPFIPINAGLEVTPKVPYVELGGVPGGDLREGVGVKDPQIIFENAKKYAEVLSKCVDHIIIGESTPAGTTTTLGLLVALGYDAKNKVSGCMVTNPHELKNSVVDAALEKNNVKPGDLADDPFKAVEIAGDPTMIAIAGLMMGADVPVILAGGSQMTAPCAIVKALDADFNFDNICIATTTYVANDETANLLDIVNQIADINVFAADPLLQNSDVVGLQNYARGNIKEGVGAGGAIFYAYIKGVTSPEYIKKAEEITEKHF
ncbi:MAG: TIGR00303 family protein [Methanosphaera sp.]|uniref:nicotinate mononucleotide-dependent phosphoribosyltransferase CobT n=1 Tax=Methanosphaera sp. TaxID=2666342 RepID=UPI0025EEC1B2|nr:TIGR00303 family protein [Methanosphaera sp.]MCI5866723.1 TIGR00303 family protein [Methanosphaera sp.]MDD6534238.1 TIGR00303 family protein [Methanosphaera sp.]MDY3956378.1 TIGR00303 family protein [Methanosphaera sp.]